MFKYRGVPVLALLLMLFATSAHAFWDPPYITPANPVAGDTISMNIRMGVCDAIYQWPGYPQITRNGNDITFLNFGQHWDPGELCTYGTGTGVFPIGSYEPGNYTLTVELFYHDFFGQPHTLTLGVVAFTVAGIAPPAVPAPTMSPLGLLALLLVLSGLAFWTLRSGRASMLLIVAIACSHLAARAQSAPNLTIQILVTNAAGAPTPAQIVNYYPTTPHVGPPPLHAFTVKSPLTVQYLIPVRAAGDFLVWLQANPNSAGEKLENIVI